jgi:hypothetical protein
MMLYSTYNLVVCGFLLIIISFAAEMAPAIWIAVTSAISCFAVMFALCVLFMPKMYLHWSGKLVDAQEIFGKAIQNRSSVDASSAPGVGRGGGGGQSEAVSRMDQRSDCEQGNGGDSGKRAAGILSPLPLAAKELDNEPNRDDDTSWAHNVSANTVKLSALSGSNSMSAAAFSGSKRGAVVPFECDDAVEELERHDAGAAAARGEDLHDTF